MPLGSRSEPRRGRSLCSILTKSMVVRVRRTLAGLKPPHRVVLALRYSLALSYEEIAETLNWSMPKVKVTIHRAKRAFKEAYVADEEVDG